MTTSIQRVHLPDGRRILMISDLHGHGAGLRELLHQARFDEQDVLILLGDYVDKGPASLATVRYVMELCGRYTVYPLLGNTDHWRLIRLMSEDESLQRELLAYSLDAGAWWGSSLLGEMLSETGQPLTPDMDTPPVFVRLRERFAPELSFLQSLPTVLETQSMIFVHGGLPHERLHELEGTPCHPLMKRDRFLDEGLSFSKYVVVGHWPVALYSKRFPDCNPIIDRKRHILSIDGGCGVRTDGQLNLLILPSHQSEDFQTLCWNPLPAVTALDDQAEGADCTTIRWGDHQVQVVERTDDSARIVHHGREMLIPASFLWQENGRWYCGGVTDYCPAIRPGDKLSLICHAAGRAYIKKDGLTGWYGGRLKPIQ